MARAGLGRDWHCTFANDFDPMKGATYRLNWGDADLLVEDINLVDTEQLPGKIDLAWASFPCQDLSLAGNFAGIGLRTDNEQTRSGTFWAFWRLIRGLHKKGRAPRQVVLENVVGALTANDGRDFAAISAAISGTGYRFGAVVVDAKLFLPHSRPRLFIICVRDDLEIPRELQSASEMPVWHPATLVTAYGLLSRTSKKRWIWWKMPTPKKHSVRFADLIESIPTGVEWNTKAQTARLIRMMSPIHRAKLKMAMKSGIRQVGAVYKRTRVENGEKIQRAEVRFDDIAGCLRTPSGGSSRQSILMVEGRSVRSRLLSPREAVRLMGLPDSYRLPSKYNDSYHVAGDGVAVPVVRFLAENLLEPILQNQKTLRKAA